MSFKLLEDILYLSKKQNKPFWRIVMEENCNEQAISESECYDQMKKLLDAMRKADQNYSGSTRSVSGMAGGMGEKLAAYGGKDGSLMGAFLEKATEKAVKMAESNACMKCIVAAPTAGSCGIIPAIVLTYGEFRNVPEERLVEALFVAGGIGEVYANSASIAGAAGGCQAEIGVAASMSAGALAYLEGGDEECIVHAEALAMKSLMGLTCDPVAGLVEVPCIKRNASGVMVAVNSAYMALAGLRSAVPPDQVVDAMRRVGNMMSESLKETSLGGLATCPAARAVAEKMSREE